MAKAYAINIAAEAARHLGGLSRYAQRIILDGIEFHLRHQPNQETRRIKTLRLNPVASWELRLADYRVLYDVAEEDRSVNVLVVGEKRGINSTSSGRSTRPMRVIDLQEAKTNLDQYAVECQTSPVVVTKEGRPIFELLPIRADDDGFLDRLIEHDPSFRDLVEQAREDVRSGRVSSIESVRERLLGSEE